jgi:phosphopantetheinyl transferase (holo-ACP synthase)
MTSGVGIDMIFLKQLDTGWAENTLFSEVEIINNKQGRPEVTLSDSTLGTISSMKIKKILLSLSILKQSHRQ